MADSTPAFKQYLRPIPLLCFFHLPHFLPLPSVRSRVRVNFCHILKQSLGPGSFLFVNSSLRKCLVYASYAVETDVVQCEWLVSPAFLSYCCFSIHLQFRMIKGIFNT